MFGWFSGTRRLRYSRMALGKSSHKDFTGRKAKGSSEKPSRRDYQPLSIKTSAPSLLPYETFTPIWKRKAPRFRILKKCMTRLEALRLIRNGPYHPAMMHDRRERAQTIRLPLGWGSRPERIFFKTLTLVSLSLYYLLFEWTGNFCQHYQRHVPWREVSSHLIALIVSHMSLSLSSTSKSLSSWTLMRDGNGGIRLPFSSYASKQLALDCIELQAFLIRCCKLRAIKSPTKQLSLKPLWSKCLRSYRT